MEKLIFDVTLQDYDPDRCLEQIESVKAAGYTVGCTEIKMEFSANNPATLVLRIPMRYVNLHYLPRKEMEHADQTDRPDL